MRIIKIKFNKYATDACVAINVYWRFKYTDKILGELELLNFYLPYKGKGSEHRTDGPCKTSYYLTISSVKQFYCTVNRQSDHDLNWDGMG